MLSAGTRPQKLAILTAMDEEFRLLERHLSNSSVTKVGPRSFYEGSLAGQDVVLACSGVGKVASATTAAILLTSYGVDAVFFTGVAGGIDARCAVGDVVVAHELVQHDFDLKGVLGYQRFHIPSVGVSRMPACVNLAKMAEKAALSVLQDAEYREAVALFCKGEPALHSGVVASGDVFVGGEVERDALRTDLPGLLCVDMEGAAVAQVCVEHAIPFVEARIISDAADSASFFDFGEFIRSAAAVGSEKMVLHFVRGLS
jgi:adenosylhomocysteine nucleosidase